MVRSVLLPYAFVLQKCSEFQTTSPLEPLGQFCSNFIQSLLRMGEWKIAKIVAARWTKMPWSYIFAKINGDRRSTKVAKIKVLYWHLTFLRQGQVCFRMHLYGKNLYKSSSPKPRMPCGWIFAYINGNGGSTKVAKIMVVHWHLTFLWQGRLLPYAFVWEEKFKNLILQNRGCLVAESFHISSGSC